MIISNCPRCHELYRIPTGSLPQNVYAQCPWCQETFSLQEAMRSLPPVLKLIGADGRPVAPVSAPSIGYETAGIGTGMSAAASGFAISDERDSGGLDDFDEVSTYDEDDATGDLDVPTSRGHDASLDDEIDPEFVINDSTRAAAIAPMRVQAPRVSGPARRKKSGSPIKTLLGFGMGAALAVPAAAAILLGLDQLGYTTAPNLGVWPMDGSFSKSSSARTLTASSASPISPNTETSSTAMDAPSTEPTPGRSLVDELGTSELETMKDEASDAASDALAAIQSPDTATTADATTADATTADATTADATTADATTSDATTETPQPDAVTPDMIIPVPDEVTSAMPVIEEPQAAEPQDAESATEAPEVISPGTEPARIIDSFSPELVSARDDAIGKLERLSGMNANDADRRTSLSETYQSVTKFVSLMDSSSASASDGIVDMIRDDAALLSDFEFAAPLWINVPAAKRTNQGIVIVGELDASESGPSIRLSNDTVIPIQWNDASPTPSGRVLGLGKIFAGAEGPSIELSRVESL